MFSIGLQTFYLVHLITTHAQITIVIQVKSKTAQILEQLMVTIVLFKIKKKNQQELQYQSEMTMIMRCFCIILMKRVLSSRSI